MHKTIFRSGAETDTVVVSFYPLAGTDANTGPRYKAEANETSFDIVGITRVGSDSPARNSALRQALSPEHFDDYCECIAPNLEKDVANYDRVIFRGQSTGSFPTLGLVKSGLVRATHLLVEDGINLRSGRNGTSQSSLAGWQAWISTQIAEARKMPKPPKSEWSAPQGQSESHKL